MLLGLLIYVRFTSESGHPEGSRKESAIDPKRTLAVGAFQRAMSYLIFNNGPWNTLPGPLEF